MLGILNRGHVPNRICRREFHLLIYARLFHDQATTISPVQAACFRHRIQESLDLGYHHDSPTLSLPLPQGGAGKTANALIS